MRMMMMMKRMLDEEDQHVGWEKCWMRLGTLDVEDKSEDVG